MKWNYKNIVHIIFFATYIVALLVNLFLIKKQELYITGILGILVATVFFILENSNVNLRGGHIAVDMFAILSIISLFIYK